MSRGVDEPKIKIVRQITFEISANDPEAMEKLARQLTPSAAPGTYVIGNGIHFFVDHIEGPRFPTDGSKWGGPRPIPYQED